MVPHPVQLHILRTESLPRVQIAVRVVLVVALGFVAWSSLYWLLYLALPAAVALDLLHRGMETFVDRDAPRLVRALRWLAGAEAYLFFLTNDLPTSTGGAVDLQVQVSGAPTAGGALLRLLFSLPALVLVAILTAASSLIWIAAAGVALVTERLPGVFGDLFVAVLRLKYRLLAYHLSLVDRYPSLSEEGRRDEQDLPLVT
ncbi:MAG TPA: DUF4389 domain-containing protein [Polyangia bacterium]|nr:DUF4389 domain-containing protein [Polyangia bacterium]